MFVFRYGNIYEYNEEYADILWTYDQLLIASSFFATCLYKNIKEQKAYSLSYMLVSNPELQYPEVYKKEIQQILNSVSSEV